MFVTIASDYENGDENGGRWETLYSFSVLVAVLVLPLRVFRIVRMRTQRALTMLPCCVTNLQ
jgi:hypothetical protein